MLKSLNLNLLAAYVGINAPIYKNAWFYNFPKTEKFEQLFKVAINHADHHEAHLSALSPVANFGDLIRLNYGHIKARQELSMTQEVCVGSYACRSSFTGNGRGHATAFPQLNLY